MYENYIKYSNLCENILIDLKWNLKKDNYNEIQILNTLKNIVAVNDLKNERLQQGNQYAELHELDDIKTFTFQKWNTWEHRLFKLLNNKYPKREYGSVVYFLLEEYDPNIHRIFKIMKQTYKKELDQKIKILEKENILLKEQITELKQECIRRSIDEEKNCILQENKWKDIEKIILKLRKHMKEEQFIQKEKKHEDQDDNIDMAMHEREQSFPSQLENCHLHHCHINHGTVIYKKISNNKKRKRTDDNHKNISENILQVHNNNTNEIIQEILKSIKNKLANELERSVFEDCLEKKESCWKYGGYLSITRNDNDHCFERIFLKKGEDKWNMLLKAIGFDTSDIKKDTLMEIKNKILTKDSVRLQKDPKCVNKRRCILLSSL